MTAPSELFVTEILRDYIPESIQQTLDKLYPGWTILIPKNWRDIWDIGMYPPNGETAILDGDDNPIGKILWKTNFFVDDGGLAGKYVNAEPKDIHIILFEKV